ncbi:hypothetical protein IQ07DRAFT_312588 [Pyrenochaeta sp. DS3sAY3a]|nr:hypothetical protein IQ07DRAFT_312588 [Pyrenochaeta sp. DS3sAY3a]
MFTELDYTFLPSQASGRSFQNPIQQQQHLKCIDTSIFALRPDLLQAAPEPKLHKISIRIILAFCKEPFTIMAPETDSSARQLTDHHPLDSLSKRDITIAVGLVKERYGAVTLRFKNAEVQEPPKAELFPYLETERAGVTSTEIGALPEIGTHQS